MNFFNQFLRDLVGWMIEKRTIGRGGIPPPNLYAVKALFKAIHCTTINFHYREIMLLGKLAK